jgi:prephenate dehydratase
VIKVAFQGERGAFSEDAVITFFGDVELSPSRYIADVFEAVLRDEADFGVVPAENSQAGSINDTYDLLLSYPLNIFGEIHLRISHFLMALPGESLDGIRIIYSHPQALAQCEQFLRKHKAELVPTYDTAGSAKNIKENGLKGCAAVAGKRAAQIYGLEILAENIETNVDNYTRFFVISKKKAESVPRSKTSLVFGIKNVAGALYACLGTFATRDINLTKLESRPSRDKPWEYIFYVDFEGHIDDKICQEAVAELRRKAKFIKILGSYPRAED